MTTVLMIFVDIEHEALFCYTMRTIDQCQLYTPSMTFSPSLLTSTTLLLLLESCKPSSLTTLLPDLVTYYSTTCRTKCRAYIMSIVPHVSRFAKSNTSSPLLAYVPRTEWHNLQCYQPLSCDVFNDYHTEDDVELSESYVDVTTEDGHSDECSDR